MKKVSVSIEPEHIELLDERQDDGDAGSRSEAVREILDEYEDMRTECEDLRTECEDLRTRLENREDRIDELEEQLRRRSQIENEVEELAMEVREQRQQANAPFFVRWYSWLRNR